jgi:hypothetical protein
MARIDRLCQCVFVLSLVIVSLSSTLAGTKRIIPVRTKVRVSSLSPDSLWSVPIKSIDGKTLYFLSLVKDTDLQNHPITIEIVLQRSGYKPDGANLLDPTGIRHGLQGCSASSVGQMSRLISGLSPRSRYSQQ